MRTPVVFIIFRRPDTTARVFEEIRKAKPPKLFIVSDAPRIGQEGEAEQCEAARAITDNVDWDCEVFKNYADSNMGLKKRISTG
ncbi:MAG: glycosyltransferase family 2 protein, partial [Cyanobacteria bacterium J06555_13]